MFEPVTPAIPWKILQDSEGKPKAYPYVGVIGIAYDEHGNFPMLFRGPNVRSVKNAWSLISGLHEIGLTLEQQLCAEVKEETGLDPILETAKVVGSYENIVGPEGFHWVMFVATVKVKTLSTFVNKEPDKHPETTTANVMKDIYCLNSPFWEKNFTPGLKEALQKLRMEIVNSANIKPADVRWSERAA